MMEQIAFIGFGEAAQAFSGADGWRAATSAFDIKTDNASSREAKLSDYAKYQVAGAASLDELLPSALNIISLVTADQAETVAKQTAEHIPQNTLFFDLNSVAPQTKRNSAEYITSSGGYYVDVAVMAPVYPKQLSTPLLVSSPHAERAAIVLKNIGFTNIRIVGEEIGRASSIKMIRSVMIKGIEALTAECVLAANQADVLEDVLSSLGDEWTQKADYNFDRMMIHGPRRAAEMEEVVKTLEDLGVDALMTRGTVSRQRQIGDLNIKAPADGLENKLSQIKQKQGQETQ